MATPEPIRHPQTRAARTSGRTGLGMVAGRTAGVGRVPRKDRRDAAGALGGFDWVYSLTDFMRAHSLAFGPTTPGISADVFWDAQTKPWGYTSSSAIIITRPGMYAFEFGTILTVAASAVVAADYENYYGNDVVESPPQPSGTSRFLKKAFMGPVLADQDTVFKLTLSSASVMSMSAGFAEVTVVPIFFAD